MTLIRTVLWGVLVLVGAATSAAASPLTVNFSGSLDLSPSGGSTDNPFSGFFTWDTTQPAGPGSDATTAFYGLTAYDLFFNGVEVDPALGAGLILINDADLFGTGVAQDALLFFAPVKQNAVVNGVTGTMALIAGFAGPSTTWTLPTLPQDYSFLTTMSTRLSLMSLEVPGGENGGDSNDLSLGSGSLEARPVPEPASLTLTAMGIAGVIARGRRGRQRD